MLISAKPKGLACVTVRYTKQQICLVIRAALSEQVHAHERAYAAIDVTGSVITLFLTDQLVYKGVAAHRLAPDGSRRGGLARALWLSRRSAEPHLPAGSYVPTETSARSITFDVRRPLGRPLGAQKSA